MMLHRRSLLSAATAATMATPAMAAVRVPDPQARLDAALDRVFEAERPVGLGAALVGPQGLVVTGARGLRVADGDVPVQADDAWHLGSNTKAMTAVLFARLVEQGLADWNMTLVEALSDRSGDHDPAWADIRIVELFQHRAGLKDEAVLDPIWFMTARADPASLPEQRRVLARKAMATAPTGPRGQFAYGNANYVLAGAAMEALTGRDWQVLMAEQIFAPLGITRAGFGAPAQPAPHGHRLAGTGYLSMAPGHPGSDNPAALGPAGTVHMPLDDYGRFLSVFLAGGEGLITPDSVARLTTPVSDPPPPYGCGWIVLDQAWAAGPDGGPGPVLTHDGSNTLWYASAAVAPARGLALVAVSNDGSAGGRACQRLLQQLALGLDSHPAT